MIRAAFAFALLFTPAASSQDEPEVWARLPEPVTNNAVAGAEVDGRMMAYSFAGLHEGKTWRDVTADAYACDLTARECREIDGLPDGIGRLASVAVNVRGQIYIFGGYTVAEDHSERSTPEVWRFDPASETYTHVTDMPVPVDDTIALPNQDRYIYLVSGWHDTDNVDLVQVYDVEEDRWFEATPFPGAPVFGHAGAILGPGNPHAPALLRVCGGARVEPASEPGGRRRFVLSEACWDGEILADRPAEIAWSVVSDISGLARYRGAAMPGGRGLHFFGGTDNPYNYNGIGYNGEAATPIMSIANVPGESRSSFCYRLYNDASLPTQAPPRSTTFGRTPQLFATSISMMDIRGLVRVPLHQSAIHSDPQSSIHYYSLGGLAPDLGVSDAVVRYNPDEIFVMGTGHIACHSPDAPTRQRVNPLDVIDSSEALPEPTD